MQCSCLAAFAASPTGGADGARRGRSTPPPVDGCRSPEPKQAGGEPDSIVQVANLVYAGTKSSQCFADHFLIKAEKETAISTSRRFHAVKLSSDELYNFPLVIMTGEGAFSLPDQERENLARYIERGGFLLASAGCSSQEWERSFRKEMALVFPDALCSDRHGSSSVSYRLRRSANWRAITASRVPLEGIFVRRPAGRALFARRA